MAAEYGVPAVESVEELGISIEPIMQCCLCKSLLQNPVQLICLHNCCQQCFTEAASRNSSGDVCCGVCTEVTPAGIEQPNRFIEHEARLNRALAGSKMCDICKEDRQSDKEAVEWCPACRHALCENCMQAHKRYNKNHRTQSLDNLGDSGAMSLHSSVTACPRHDKLLELACFDCEKEICVSCWEDCSKSKHEVHALCNTYFNDHVGKLTTVISSIENELLKKADILNKPKSILTDLTAARNEHLQQIEQRKRRILEAVDTVGQKISDAVRDMYDDLEMKARDAAVTADCLNFKLSDARMYVKKLLESSSKGDIFSQHNAVRKRLTDLSNELASLHDLLDTTMKEPYIRSTLPDDLEVLLEGWIGVVHSVFSFGAASASFKLPVLCEDISLTKDGSLLLAARKHGLIELCSETGRELSRWLPPKQSFGEGHTVEGVAALSDGRAAVSYAMLIGILRRNGEGDEARAAAAWTEECRCDKLSFVPGHLSAHGDMLAVADVTDGYRSVLQLMCISSLLPLSDELFLPDGIGCLALAARVVIIGSVFKVLLNGGKEAQVLDAYRLPGCNELLWRYKLSSNDEEFCGVCADATGGCLYAAIQGSSRNCGRVTALSLADGSEMRNFALTLNFPSIASQPLLLPVRLSLREDGAAEQRKQSSGTRSSRVLQLAALCWDSATNKLSTVTVHQSKRNK